MKTFDKNIALKMIESGMQKARELNLNPIMIVILDHRGAVKACLSEEGASPLRYNIAFGKANGAYQMSMGSRSLFNRAEQQAYFINSINNLTDGNLIPVPGGVLIKDDDNEIVGSIGISGDTSDNDELAAIEAVKSVGYKPDVG